MLHTKETGIAAIRRWKAGRAAPRWDAGPSGTGTFAEDLALFERQVRDEAGLRVGASGRKPPTSVPANTAA